MGSGGTVGGTNGTSGSGTVGSATPPARNASGCVLANADRRLLYSIAALRAFSGSPPCISKKRLAAGSWTLIGAGVVAGAETAAGAGSAAGTAGVATGSGSDGAGAGGGAASTAGAGAPLGAWPESAAVKALDAASRPASTSSGIGFVHLLAGGSGRWLRCVSHFPVPPSLFILHALSSFPRLLGNLDHRQRIEFVDRLPLPLPFRRVEPPLLQPTGKIPHVL